MVDPHGHLNGSRAIQEAAATIRQTISEPTYAVAYAGDEFVVVLPGANPSQAVQTADSIRAEMDLTFYLRELGLNVKLRASFGIGAFPDHAEDVMELLAAADRALFAVKEKGKNAIGLAAPPADASSTQLQRRGRPAFFEKAEACKRLGLSPGPRERQAAPKRKNP